MRASEIFMYSLGALIVLGFFVILMGLLVLDIPKNNEQALYLALGTLFSSFAGVVGYFYGSSAGSKHKTDLMAGKQDKL
jgi:hypothetical protein